VITRINALKLLPHWHHSISAGSHLLSNIYIHLLPGIHLAVRYADDHMLVITIPHKEYHIVADLAALCEYWSCWNIEFASVKIFFTLNIRHLQSSYTFNLCMLVSLIISVLSWFNSSLVTRWQCYTVSLGRSNHGFFFFLLKHILCKFIMKQLIPLHFVPAAAIRVIQHNWKLPISITHAHHRKCDGVNTPKVRSS